MSELEKKLRENLTVKLWPDTGEALGISRGATYDAAKRGEIATIDIGRIKRVSSAWLRQKLGLTPSA
jgi:hypothetical protein